MKNRFERLTGILPVFGQLLQVLGLVLLLPLIVAGIYWGRYGDGWHTVKAYLLPAALALTAGTLMRIHFKAKPLDVTSSMLICALGWLVVSAFSALPFVVGLGTSYLDAYFEAMSGFTTTGITIYTGLDNMPRSILFWRSLTQWLGGIGILSFFLAVTYRSGASHHIFGAESHKIASTRPAPGIFHTLRILWSIYAGYTLLAVTVLTLEKMPFFDAVCHSLTALSTGGFSPHDSSILFYRLTNHPNHRLIEYTITFIMLLGGINFLIHYRVLTKDVKALWDNLEIRYWWRLIAALTAIILIDHLYKTGALRGLVCNPVGARLSEMEPIFRNTIFQVVSILTTTGFATQDIGSEFFPAASKQLFLVMMVIGGCVGSTGGGLKVLRVAILNRLLAAELFKLRIPSRASHALVVDGKIVPDTEVQRVAALFFMWMGLLVVGSAITTMFSNLGPWESSSGMFSALGNIGPCYISVKDMIGLAPVVKLTYIFGMLAGRLEILPVLLLFSSKAWK